MKVTAKATAWYVSLSLAQRKQYHSLHPTSLIGQPEAQLQSTIDGLHKTYGNIIGSCLYDIRNSLHSNRVVANLLDIAKHLAKQSKPVERIADALEDDKLPSKKDTRAVNAWAPVTAKYKKGTPDPKVASLVHLAKATITKAAQEPTESIAYMYMGDAADALLIAHYIQIGQELKANRLLADLDTGARDEIPSRVWNWHLECDY